MSYIKIDAHMRGSACREATSEKPSQGGSENRRQAQSGPKKHNNQYAPPRESLISRRD
jgi:hypothetical protein